MTESAPSTLAGDAPVLDLFAPDFAPDSAETLAAQEKSWYAATSVGVAVLRYEQAQKLLRDPRLRTAESAVRTYELFFAAMADACR